MGYKLRLLWYDCKDMGIMFFLPIVGYASICLYAPLGFAEINGMMRVMELFLPPIGTWWVIQGMYNYVEGDGSEVFTSFPISRWVLGVERSLIFLGIHSICMGVVVALVFSFIKDSNSTLGVVLWIQLVIQSYFYLSFAFFLTIYFKSILWSLGGVMIYLSASILAPPSFLTNFNVYFFSGSSLSIGDLFPRGIVIIIISTFLLIKGERLFEKNF